MERKTIEENKENKRDYAVLVGLRSPVLGADSADEESLAELGALVETAGGEPVGTILQSREKPDPHSFIGEGKVEEVRRMVDNSDATMVIFDNDLSPSQIRVLTELCGVQVLDRSGLILDIFAQRAKTKEGCLQVELAQYQYLLPWPGPMMITVFRGSSACGRIWSGRAVPAARPSAPRAPVRRSWRRTGGTSAGRSTS